MLVDALLRKLAAMAERAGFALSRLLLIQDVLREAVHARGIDFGGAARIDASALERAARAVGVSKMRMLGVAH